MGALDELAFTPCASDAEFLEKLRYLYAQQAKVGWDLPDNGDDYGCIVVARPPRERPIAWLSAPLFRLLPSDAPWPWCYR